VTAAGGASVGLVRVSTPAASGIAGAAAGTATTCTTKKSAGRGGGRWRRTSQRSVVN
jgi:hypothetical protein